MSLPGIEYLHHILAESHYLAKAAEGVPRDEFMRDETLKRAFVRSLEVIGEAAKHVPDELRRKYGRIDWRAMAGMRDRLIHAYFGVDYEIVWDAVTNKVPGLSRDIENIVQGEQQT